MDKKYRKIIDEALSCLNWEVIVDTYKDYERIISKRKRDTTIDSIKTDLRNLCNFIIENNISYFDQDQFVITWRTTDMDHKLGSKLEIMYVPTRACAFGNEEYEPRLDELGDVEYELQALASLLEGAVAEENYELAAVLRDRIKDVRKELVYVNAK